ncbi:MAG: pseudouridine-5'-phosphate glycosidase [Planctomycetota bacterium]|nr:MAG: pseudouridine-5'-phosphate glycosidase [Planctomycetota bacterium]
MTRPGTRQDDRPRVALESALPVLGVPASAAGEVIDRLDRAVRDAGAEPLTVAVLSGQPVIGANREDLLRLARAPGVTKVNTSNLGAVMHAGLDAATTVSATMEIASGAGVRVMATGGIGGVHRGAFDVSADLVALTRYPVAVVCSGCKSILDARATREALETLGVPVIGVGADEFPAFYLRSGGSPVDARFDDPADLARFLDAELARTGRGVVVANPIPEADAVGEVEWSTWLAEAQRRAGRANGRDATPEVLAALHEASGGATLRANLALAEANARLAGGLAAALVRT